MIEWFAAFPGLQLDQQIAYGSRNRVFRARLRGQLVAFKIPRPENESQDYFREAALQGRLQFAGLARVHEVGTFQGVGYLVQEWLDGQTLEQRLSSGPLTIEEISQWLPEFLTRLAWIHSSGLVHGDLKPSNLLLDSQGQVRLLDFGLSLATEGQPLGGTSSYCSPEQSGWLQRPIDARSDLYSLGVVLFEALSGKLPFEGQDWVSQAAPLSQVPPVWAEAVARLLCKDPDDRYFNCESLHQDLFAQPPRRRPKPLPGRASEQAQLRRMERGLIWISGEAGAGKSALAQCWLDEQRLRSPQKVVLRAKCQPSEEPFGLFRQLLEDGLRQLKRLSESHQITWKKQLAGLFESSSGQLQKACLAHFSPNLAKWLGHQPCEIIPEEYQGRYFQALGQFFSQLSAQFPLLILVEDLHWIDRSSRPVWRHWCQVLAKTSSLCLATSRSSEGGNVAQLQIALTRLNPSEVAEVVELELGGSVEVRLVEQVLLMSQGNPLGVVSCLDGATFQGLFVPDWGRWRVREEGLAQLELTTSLWDLLLARLRPLSNQARQHLTRLAVLGFRFCLEEARLHCGEQVEVGLAEATRLGLLQRSHSQFSFVHDRLPESLLESLSQEQLAQLHREIGMLVQCPWKRASHLWLSWTEGADFEVFAAQIEGGFWNTQRLAWSEAYDCFERANACRPPGVPWTFEVLECWAEVALLSGHFPRCQPLLEQALEIAEQPWQRALVYQKLTYLAIVSFDSQAGWSALRRGLSELGLKFGATGLGRLWNFPRKCFPRLRGQPYDEVALKLYQVGLRLSMIDPRPVEVGELLVASLNLSSRLPLSNARAFSVAFAGLVFASLGWRKWSLSWLQRAQNLAQELGSPTAVAQVQIFRAQSLRLLGHEQDSAELAEITLRESGQWLSTFDYLLACFDLIHNLHFRGYVTSALHWAEAASSRLREENFPPLLAYTLAAVHTAAGRYSEAARELELGRHLGADQSALMAMTDRVCRLHCELERWELGQSCDERLTQLEDFETWSVPFHIRQVFILEGHCRWRQGNVALLKLSLARLRRGRSGVFEAHRTFLQAALAWLEGQPKGCYDWLEKARRQAHSQCIPWLQLEVARLSARLFESQGKLELARQEASLAFHWAQQLGWVSQMERLRHEFPQACAQMVRPDSPSSRSTSGSLQRSLKALLSVSAQSAQWLDPDLIGRHLLAEVMDWLPAQRAHLYLADAKGSLNWYLGLDHQRESLLGGPTLPLLWDRMLVQAEPILGSLDLAAIARSSLAAPVLLGERLLGLICLEHDQVQGAFSQEDGQLLLALGRHLAVSLETARSARLEVSVRSERQQRILAERLGHWVGLLLHSRESEAILDCLLKGLLDMLGGDQAAAFRLKGAVMQAEVRIGSPPEWSPPEGVWARPFWDEGQGVLWSPLVSLSGSLGWVALKGNSPPSSADCEVAGALCGYASLALENSLLFEDVQRLATSDELTGLFNRRHFLQCAREEWQRSQRLGHALCVAIFDIDHFKKFNDNYGHSVGDTVLATVSTRCRDSLRSIDLLGRLGGEEFGLLLVGSGLSEAAMVAERLRLRVAEESFPTAAGPLGVTVSLGLAQKQPEETLEQVMERADAALYEAKRSGRNCLRLAVAHSIEGIDDSGSQQRSADS